LRAAIQKSRIPPNRVFIIKDLRDKHFDPIWHFHSEYQLFWVSAGSGTRFVGDNVKPFNKGELVFTGPGLPHLWRSDDIYFDKHTTDHSKGIVLYLQEDFLGTDIMQKNELTDIKKLLQRSTRGLEFYGATRAKAVAIINEIKNATGIYSVIRLLEMLDVLAHSKEFNYISNERNTRPYKEAEANNMNKVYAYVMDQFKQEIKLEALASIMCMTPTSFSRYFTSKTNKSFSQFVIELRIQHACKLLLQEEQSIASVAYDCGFKTLSNFNKQFRKFILQTPSIYRKQFLEM